MWRIFSSKMLRCMFHSGAAQVMFCGPQTFFFFSSLADDSCPPLIRGRLMRAEDEAKTVQVRLVRKRLAGGGEKLW